MPRNQVTLSTRSATEQIAVIDVKGEITAFVEAEVLAAFESATSTGARAIIWNFNQLEFVNSSGIGLLVTLLIRAKRLSLEMCAYGLSEHFRRVFELTRLSEAFRLFNSEEEALESLAGVK